MTSEPGGAKKFLYTGPKSRDVDETEDLPWNFNSKNTSPRGTSNMNGSSNTMATKFGMEDVWSIKRDVNVGARQQKTDGLTFNTNKSYYSRYGGMKDKDSVSSLGSSNLNSFNQGTAGASWNMTQARRPFSYSFNSDPKQKTPQPEPPVSSRNMSNSSFSHYSNTGNTFSSNNTNSQFNNKYKSPW